MEYLKKKYNKLSDIKKQEVLPEIIKFLEKEKKKVDDKVNGISNGYLLLKELNIEEYFDYQEEINLCNEDINYIKERLDNDEIDQDEHNVEVEIKRNEIKEYEELLKEQKKKVTLNDILECTAVIDYEYESGWEGEWTRDSYKLEINIKFKDGFKIEIHYIYDFDNNNHKNVFYKQCEYIYLNDNKNFPHYKIHNKWIFGNKDTPIKVLQPKSFLLINMILEKIDEKNIYEDYLTYMDK